MSYSLLIVGGGTGGHISPAIALFEECKKSRVDAYVLIGRSDRKFKYIGEIESDRLFCYRAPSLTKNPLKFPFVIMMFLFSVFSAMRKIKKNGIDYVIGMGGYVSAPALYAAKLMKKPYFLCEQNVHPGKVTRMFIKSAKEVFTTFEETKNYVKTNMMTKLNCVGNPIRTRIMTDVDRNTAKETFNLSHCDKVILAIGGSQGAVTINELVVGLKLKYTNEMKNIGIIWSTGDYSYEKYKKMVLENKAMGSVYISRFIEDVGLAYKASDLAISRSGAGVMVEMVAMGVPSILIPYPYSANDHQNKNADVYVKAGVAVKVDDVNATSEKIGPVLLEILRSENRLEQMKKKCRAIAKTDAGKKILSRISEQ